MLQPLLGVKVVDLSRVLAGPIAGMILGDLGADVIKVERPDTGDDSRSWGPPFDTRGESAYYLSCNRNKLSVAADLDSHADRELVHRLIAGADVVIDNFRRGVLEERGLAPDELIRQYPQLIWCTVTGFGPDRDRPGYDFVVQAESGWMAITGEPDGAPMKVGVALVDVLTGRDAAIAVLAALVGRSNGREMHRRLHVSLQASAVSALVNVAQNALVTGRDAVRWGNAHASLVPYELFEASDRALVIAVGSDAQFVALARALELTALSASRFATNALRVEHRDEVVQAIRGCVASRPAAHWVDILSAAGVPCGLVRSVLEALADVEGSALLGVRPPDPSRIRRPPPRLNEHGAALRARGWKVFAELPVLA